jgi:UDP-3-O-[3-hydroxymyristoyl] glucosamine N-acyltransferase
VGIAGHLNVADQTIITAQSGVSKDTETGSLLSGSPARSHKENMRFTAFLNKLFKEHIKKRS